MADEIIVLSNGSSNRYRVVFYYAIPSGVRLTVGDTGVNVVPTPSSGLDPIAAAVMDAAKITALDAGEALFVNETMNFTGMNGAQMIAAAKARRTAMTSGLLDKYASKYKHVGLEIDG